MLTYKEFKKIKQAEQLNEQKEAKIDDLEFTNIEKTIDNLTSEIVGFTISEKRFDNFINFCENISDFGNKWKTIQEHRVIQQLPLIIKDTLEEECLSYRLLVNDAKIEIKKTLREAENLLDPWAQLQNREKQAANDIKRKIDQIFTQLKTDLLNQYGVNRGVQSQRPNTNAAATQYSNAPTPIDSGDFELGADSTRRQYKKPGLWKRTKDWLKSVWHGATGGDPNLRKYALDKGYADTPYYSNDPNAYKDRKKFPQYFEDVATPKLQELEEYLKEDFEEARNTFHGIFEKYKKELLDLVAQYALKVFSKEKIIEPESPQGPDGPENTDGPDDPKDPDGPENTDGPEDPNHPENDGSMPQPDDDKESDEDEPKAPSGFEDAMNAKKKIKSPEDIGILANSRDINPETIKKAWDTKIDHGDDKYTFTINYKGNDYTFSPEQHKTTKKYHIFQKDGIRIQVTKSKWDNAIKEDETISTSEVPKDELRKKDPITDKKSEEIPIPEDPDHPENDESMPQPDDDKESKEEIPAPDEPEEKTEDPDHPENDETMPQPDDEIDDDEEAEIKNQPKSGEETGTSKDFSNQDGFEEIDPEKENDIEDDESGYDDFMNNQKIIDAIDKNPELAKLLQDNPDLWTDKKFTSDPEKYYLDSKNNKDKNKSEEEADNDTSNYYGFSEEDIPENIIDIIDDAGATEVSSSNLKKIKKDDNGNLIFNSHGKNRTLNVVYHKGNNRVYLYYPLSSKGRYNVKYMEKSKFDELTEEKDIKVAKNKSESKPEVESKPEQKKHYDIDDIKSVGQRGLDRL